MGYVKSMESYEIIFGGKLYAYAYSHQELIEYIEQIRVQNEHQKYRIIIEKINPVKIIED